MLEYTNSINRCYIYWGKFVQCLGNGIEAIVKHVSANRKGV